MTIVSYDMRLHNIMILQVIKYLNAFLSCDLAEDFTQPKTKGNYKGSMPPIYILDGINTQTLETMMTNSHFPGLSPIVKPEKLGTLFTITNNMMLGKRWMKKDFELKDGCINYSSHSKTKGTHVLQLCAVSESDGIGFTVAIPPNVFAFVIKSTDPNNMWEMQLCADTSEERAEWIDAIRQSIAWMKSL